MEPFCTCNNLKCALHPSGHKNGCDPCIRKNLKTKEMPSCFFDLMQGAVERADDSFESFAKLVMEKDN